MSVGDYPSDAPLISVWVTVTHRKHVLECLPSFLDRCTYPNYELLICHEGHEATLEFINGVKAPGKQIWQGPRPLATKYRELRERSSGEYYYSIQDDWLYFSDPGPIMLDATRLMSSFTPICMVRMTSHAPVFVDMRQYYSEFATSIVGPILFAFGLVDMQTIIHKRLFEKFPNLWPDDMDFYAADKQWQQPIREHGWESAVMLKYWGCNIHVGNVGDRGWQTEENRLCEREGKLIQKYNMFGLRPLASLYTTWMNEELRKELLYPFFLYGRATMVPNPVPVTAQTRLGKSEGVLVT